MSSQLWKITYQHYQTINEYIKLGVNCPKEHYRLQIPVFHSWEVLDKIQRNVYNYFQEMTFESNLPINKKNEMNVEK